MEIENLLERWCLMFRKILCVSVLFSVQLTWAQKLAPSLSSGSDYFSASYGELLPESSERVGLWWCSSGWKISRDRPLPESASGGRAVEIRTARNEAEAAQLVIRPTVALEGLTAYSGTLKGPDGAKIAVGNIDVLEVRYVNVELPTDKSSVAGPWPDPLPPIRDGIDLEANKNQPLWIRVKAPRDIPAGIYTGRIYLHARNYRADVALRVEVYDFDMPDKMTCTTAFGFSPRNVFKYHKLTTKAQSSGLLSEKRRVLDLYWANLGAHHISPYDPAPLDDLKVTWPEITRGEGVSPLSRSDRGRDGLGTQGRDALATDTDTIKPWEIVPKFDWTAWDAAMARGIDHYNFNSFRLRIPGMGGGTFHSRREPELLGFSEDTPEYKAAFTTYCRAMQEHLREKGWLDEAFVYWFDEPAPKDYDFVMNGFKKLKDAAPDITRMLTEQVEPELIGGPDIWCSVSNRFDEEAARERREHGEKFWWYVCTGPKAPYCTLFIDHPATELRVWLWQTWQRKIDGILVWQSNYWTSPTAYPDPDRPQNPYEDPMGWRTGYSTPKGAKRPWGNGDGRFIYPPAAAADAHPAEPVIDGPVDSIRWEMLRDGIEDYEYMVILETLLMLSEDLLNAEQLREYTALLDVPADVTSDMTTFTKDPAPIEKRRDEVARAIVSLMKL